MRSRAHLARAFSALVAAAATTLVAPTAEAAAKPGKTSACEPTAKACVDLEHHTAWLTDGNGHVTYGPVPARGGKHGATTPTGTFPVLYKDKNHYSKQFDAPMPYSVFFYPGDALHADNPGTASNGCVHLTRPAARHFYEGLQQGDAVQVLG
jgi:hypothetical protein